MRFKVRISSRQKTKDMINEGLKWQKRFAWLPKFCDHHLGDYRSLIWLSFYYERKALRANEYSTDDYVSAKAKLVNFDLKEHQYKQPGSAWRLSCPEYIALTIENSRLIKYHAYYTLRDSRYTVSLYLNSCDKDNRIKFEDSDRY